MTVAQTSMDAYRSLNTDKIAERQEVVLRYIADHPECTAEEIFKALGYKTPNSTSPRITELLDLNMIEVTGRKVNDSGRSAMTYRVCEWVFTDVQRGQPEAEAPSDEEDVDARPLTQWSKTEIIRSCQENGVPEDCIAILRRMSLPDIRGTTLIHHDTRVTGSKTDAERTRHTRFWVVDYDFVRGMGATEGDSE